MDLKELTIRMMPVIQAASDFIQQHAGKVTTDEIEIKSRNSLVSFVDKEAEKILVAGLHKLLPAASFITEEDTVDTVEAEYTWIIDPLDGTTNFLQDIPFYSVSVALTRGQEILIGVVMDVVHRECYYAWKGGGAWCNDKPIRVSDRHDILESVVATGFPYATRDVLPQLTSVFEFFLKNARGIRRLGSAALDLAYVANGRFDVYYETSLNAWDIAGGILLVKEAGGVVTDFKNEDDMLKNGRVIAASPGIHQAVVEHIHSIFGD